MTWRPWIISAFAMVAFIFNVVLLQAERIPVVEKDVGPQADLDKELRSMQYIASSRRANFEKFGMDFQMAEATATHIQRFEKQHDRFAALLAEQAAEAGTAFCPSDGLPQPYAALAFLVEEENGIRRVVDWSTLRRLDPQPWYLQSLTEPLYDKFERTEAGKKKESTLMAVSAILLNKEGKALDGESPWATGLTGNFGFGRLAGREPRVRQLAIEYFGLMHLLTEIANGSGGICQ